MKTKAYVNKALKEAGISRWSIKRSEAKVLAGFLKNDETIEACVKGFYRGGKGILVATSQRLLLLDKNLTSLYTRAVAYDSISSIKFSKHFINSSIFVTINGRNILFRSSYVVNLRRLSAYLRGKVAVSQNAAQSIETSMSIFTVPSFEESKRVLTPRHRHGKFLISLR